MRRAFFWVGSAALVAAVLQGESPALAQGPPQIQSGGCDQTAYASDSKDHRDHFECSYYVTGGIGTVTAAYYGAVGVAHSTPTDTGTIFTYTGLCRPSQPIAVTARFTDSSGAHADQTNTLACSDS